MPASNHDLLPLLLWVCLPGLLTAIPAPPTTTVDPSRSNGFFPNPQTHFQECGETGRPSWVCDTARELQPETILKADSIINMIRNSSSCPCAQNECRDKFYGGYKLAVAVVSNLAGELNTSTQSGSEFIGNGISGGIRRVQWKFGACDEDMVILISVAARAVYISVGEKVRTVFSLQCQLEMEYRFRKAVDAGQFDHTLILTLHHLKAILLNHRRCSQSSQTVIRWWHMIIIGLGLLILIFVIMGIFLKTRRRGTAA